MKKLLCLLLSMLMLPLGMLIPSDASTAETVPDIWALIERFEDARFAEAQLAAKDATARDYAALSNDVADVVTGWSGYVDGSLVRHGDFLFWDGTDGEAYGYSPRLREKMRSGNATGADPVAVSGIETVSYAKRGGSPASATIARSCMPSSQQWQPSHAARASAESFFSATRCRAQPPAT